MSGGSICMCAPLGDPDASGHACDTARRQEDGTIRWKLRYLRTSASGRERRHVCRRARILEGALCGEKGYARTSTGDTGRKTRTISRKRAEGVSDGCDLCTWTEKRRAPVGRCSAGKRREMPGPMRAGPCLAERRNKERADDVTCIIDERYKRKRTPNPTSCPSLPSLYHYYA